MNKPMAPIQHNGILKSKPGLDSKEGHAGRRAHSAPGHDATHGGSPETFLPGLGTPPTSASASPPSPLKPETWGKGWLCGYDNRQHPLHRDFIRQLYPEGDVMEVSCQCLPGMRCGTHHKNSTQQAQIDRSYQRRVEACLVKEDERTYQFYW